MNKFQILKTLAPGFLPLIIFIIADSIWGTTIGLIVAIISGFIEVIISYIKERVVDKFVLLDIGLITALGLVSIILHNDIFFKLKPALIELIFSIIIGVSAFTETNIMLMMTKRYMKTIEFSDEQLKLLKKNLKTIFYIFVIHTILIVYSAFFMSKDAWAFISTGLFYIIFALYFVIQLGKKKMQKRNWDEEYKDDEWFDLVNERGEVIGRAPRTICHSSKGYLHPVVHLHIIDDRDRIYLQKRSKNKKIQPGKWDTAVGGHMISGEDLKSAIQREAFEELGLKEFEAQLISTYIWESDIESEFVYTFVSRYNGVITINPDEIEDGKFWRIKKIKENIGKEVFTPNFEFEFKILLDTILKK